VFGHERKREHESKFGNTRQHSAALHADSEAPNRAVPCRTVPTPKT
jgi:hypothetical protein